MHSWISALVAGIKFRKTVSFWLLALSLGATGCKGPWVNEFKSNTDSSSTSLQISTIADFYLDGNGPGVTKTFQLTNVSTAAGALNCTTSVSAHSSSITLIPATFMPITGTAPNCQIVIYPAPTTRGTGQITLTATDGTNTAVTSFNVNLYGAPITTVSTPPNGLINKIYTGFTVAASGGLAPYTYALQSGTLPAGLSLDASTGAVAGTPTVGGTFSNLIFQATGSNGQVTTAPAVSFTIYQPTLSYDFTAASTLVSLDSSFTFARTSNATRLNASGAMEDVIWGTERFDHDSTTAGSGLLVEAAGANLFSSTENLDSSFWTLGSNTAISANSATAPTGATTAEKLYESSTTAGVHSLQYAPSLAFSGAQSYSFSIFVKAAGRTSVLLQLGSSTSTTDMVQAFCNLTGTATNSTVTSPSWTFLSAASRAMGSGWYRCSVSGISPSAASTISASVHLSNGTTDSYAGTSGNGVYLWGAQLEKSATPTTYIPARNLALFSEEADKWVADASASVTANPTTSANVVPGLVAADKVTDSNTSFFSSVNPVGVTDTIALLGATSTKYIVSIYVAQGTGIVGLLGAFTGGTAATYGIAVDVSSGNYQAATLPLSTVTAPTAAAVTAVSGTSYYRVSMLVTANSNNTAFKVSFDPAWASGTLTSSSLSSSKQGDYSQTGSATIWGLQVEPVPSTQTTATPSAYYHTSTPTGSISQTNRDAETVILTSLGSWFSASQGTLVTEMFAPATASATMAPASFSNAAFTNRFSQGLSSSGVTFDFMNSGSAQTPLATAYSASGIFRLASGYQTGNYAAQSAGGAAASQSAATVATTPSVTQLNFGQQGNGASYFNGNVRKFSYYGSKIPNTLLYQLSQ